MSNQQPRVKLSAVGIHLLTASGALIGLLAIKAASEQQYELVFFWLGIALIIDAVDGPLARKIKIAEVLPRFSGARLDIIVDYMNYVAVPAYLVLTASLVPQHLRLVAAALITVSALYHFSDKESKTKDGYFVGFPACWNIIIFYLFALSLPQTSAFLIIAMFTVLTFIPLKWMHMVRVVKLRIVTLTVLLITALTMLYTLYFGFPAELWAKTVFVAAGLYALIFSLIRSFLSDTKI